MQDRDPRQERLDRMNGLADATLKPLGFTAVAGTIFALEYHDVISVPSVIENLTQGVAIIGAITSAAAAIRYIWNNLQ